MLVFQKPIHFWMFHCFYVDTNRSLFPWLPTFYKTIFNRVPYFLSFCYGCMRRCFLILSYETCRILENTLPTESVYFLIDAWWKHYLVNFPIQRVWVRILWYKLNPNVRHNWPRKHTYYLQLYICQKACWA
jgi:hypothetical protein